MIRVFLFSLLTVGVFSATAQVKRTLKPVGKLQALETAVRIDIQTLEKPGGAATKSLRFSAGRLESTGIETHANEIASQDVNDFLKDVEAIQSKTTAESPKGNGIEYYTETKDGLRFSAYTQVAVWKYALQFRDPNGERYVVMLDAKDLVELVTFLKAASQDF
jgi:hypothetical protein